MGIRVGLIGAFLAVAVGGVATAQQFTGGVRGAVHDANGVIPGVSVTLTNQATNISREVTTNDVGQYNFPAVPPGTYSLKANVSGYKTFESKDLAVGTQQFITLDVTLEVGAIEESVTVTGQSPLIDTSTASTGGVLDRQALESLPAPGRNAFLIGVTVPTVMAGLGYLRVPAGRAQGAWRVLRIVIGVQQVVESATMFGVRGEDFLENRRHACLRLAAGQIQAATLMRLTQVMFRYSW